MKQTITFQDFADGFRRMGRGDQLSYEGLKAIFDYYEQLEEETGEEVEFDVVAIYCDWAEYDNLEEFNKDTGAEVKNIEELEEKTTVIKADNGHIIVLAF